MTGPFLPTGGWPEPPPDVQPGLWTWFQQILAFGWRCAPLGLPQCEAGSTLAALRIDIDAATRALLAAADIVPDQGREGRSWQ